MLRYKTETRPSLVALYDIQPGNRAGQFLQPRARTGLWFTMKRRYIKCMHLYLYVVRMQFSSGNTALDCKG